MTTKETESPKEKMVEEHVQFVVDHAVPKSVTLSKIVMATQVDPVVMAGRRAVLSSRWRSELENCAEEDLPALKHLYLVYEELTVPEDLCILMRGWRIVIPSSLQETIVTLAREDHQGMVKIKSLLRTKVWFSGIDSHVQKIVGHYLECQTSVVDNSRVPLEMSPLPDGPWLELSMDRMDLPNGKYLLVVMVDYSRFPTVEHHHHRQSSPHSIECCPHSEYHKLSTPTMVGLCFVSEEFESFAEYFGFEHRRITPRWPCANEEMECMKH